MNHDGMQRIGGSLANGLTFEEIQAAQKRFSGCQTELIALHESCKDERVEVAPAWVLILRNGLNCIVDADEMYKEQKALKKDTRALMYGRVMDKKSRHNLCFGDEPQKADYELGKGTIVPWKDVPLTSRLRDELPTFFGPKATKLVAEGNYYYDPTVCGVGFHGDSERRVVIAARLGVALPLHYQWFYEGKPVGQRIPLVINHGDLYVMSDKAVGTDWKQKSVPTLRHAAGSKAFLAL